MDRFEIVVENQPLTVSPDDAPASVDRFWAVIGFRVVDELTGRPPQTSAGLATTYPRLTPRTAADGTLGLVGIPRNAFPDLQTTNYAVEMTVRVPGYVKRTWTEILPAQPGFPAEFTPHIPPDLHLHRLPVMLGGRTVVNGAGAATPAAGATVRVTGIWRTPPPADAVVPAGPPLLVHLDPPVYAERPAAAAAAERVTLTPVVGDEKSMTQSCSAGSRILRLTNRLNLTPGEILLLDAQAADRSEHLAILSVEGGSTPEQEAVITLEHPAAYAHRKSTVVRRVSAVSAGPANNLSDAAIPGDAVVFLGGVNGLSTAGHIRLSGGGAAEFHRFRPYATVSGAAGYFRLPPLSRVAWVELEADDGVHPAVKTVVSPDYQLCENVVDLVIG
ncbi:MAG: hypothetical protein JW929_09715 [Anaerolineales bacterium]|nr:hypothetical protein [Anaerolineales bacterium]